MSDHQNSVSAEEFRISYALKGLLWAVSITVVLAVISALLLQYTALSESLLSGFATFIFFISMFIGSTIAAYTAQGKGLLYGATVSLTYFLLTLLGGLLLDISLLSFPFILKRFGMAACAGILGGIIGVGLVSK
jgi:putative membrane protein (TIGR04086 family)